MDRGEFLDLYGVPDTYVDAVAYRELVGPNLMRSAFFTCQQGQRVITAKLLIPISVCAFEHHKLFEFITAQGMVHHLGRLAS